MGPEDFVDRQCVYQSISLVLEAKYDHGIVDMQNQRVLQGPRNPGPIVEVFEAGKASFSCALV